MLGTEANQLIEIVNEFCQ